MARDLSQWAVAKVVGRLPDAICQWERGPTLPRRSVDIEALERYLELRPGTLRDAYERDYVWQQADLTDQRFGRLVVKRLTPMRINRRERSTWEGHWLCECDCGNFNTVSASDLTSGATKSCGCFKHDYRPSPRDPRTVCINGHAKTGDNLYVSPDGRLGCNTCRRLTAKRWNLRRKEEGMRKPQSLLDIARDIYLEVL
jgi:hypothetical protein